MQLAMRLQKTAQAAISPAAGTHCTACTFLRQSLLLHWMLNMLHNGRVPGKSLPLLSTWGLPGHAGFEGSLRSSAAP